jgi:hypothetical protein
MYRKYSDNSSIFYYCIFSDSEYARVSVLPNRVMQSSDYYGDLEDYQVVNKANEKLRQRFMRGIFEARFEY